jgi:hypothetical protein
MTQEIEKQQGSQHWQARLGLDWVGEAVKSVEIETEF